MANSVATVASLQGQAWAKAPDGKLRPLKVGDTVAADEVVVTATGAKIELDFGDGHPVSIAGGQEVAMDRDLWVDLASDNKDAAIDNASVQEALTVLNNGGDLTTTLDETAAGLDGGGGSNEGHSFIELTRVVESTEPNAFNFGVDNTGAGTTPNTFASAVPVNNTPIVNAQSFTGNEDTAISGRVIATDVENDTLTYSLTGQAANGVIVLDPATGDFTYTANANYNGPDSFVVTITDDHGNTTTTTVSLTVNAVNDAPVSNNQNLTTLEDTPVSGQVVATDTEGDTLSYSLTTAAAHGSVALNPATGGFTYTPSADYNGADSFVVSIADGNGGVTTSTINIGVTPVNDTPVSNNQNLTTLEDTPISGTVVATDVDGDTLAYSVTSNTTNGTVTLNPATGAFVYTPSANYNGSDSFVVTIQDGQGGVTTSTINIGVTPVNDAPVSSNQNLTTLEDSPISGAVVATDVDGDTLAYSVTSNAANGTVTLNPATGAFVYTPSANYNGSDSFVVTIADGQGGVTTSTINIGVTPVNDAPVSSNQSLTTPEDTPISGLVVATDVDGNTLAYSVTSNATNGTVTLNPATGAFVYTPSANYNGSDSFVVTIQDGQGGVTTSTINIGVTPVNDAPVSSNQNLTTPEDTPISGAVVATDVDGNTLAYSVTSSAAHGAVTLNPATGAFVYSPSANYNGSDSFVVTIQDGQGGVTTSTINIGVTPVNDAPVSSNQNLTTPEDTPISGAVVATDVDADTLAYAVTSNATHGTVTLNAATGAFVYTPSANYNGSDSFVVTINDGKGGTTTSTINIGITPVNDAPVSSNQNLTTQEDTPISGAVVATDVDGDTLAYSVTSNTTNGSVVLNPATGAFVYTPSANYNGSDSFVVTIADGKGGVTTSTINIGVTPVNDAPVGVADSITVAEGGTATILVGGANSVLANDTDTENNPLNAILVTGPTNGTISLNANGTFSYTHNGSETTTDSFTYKVNDGTVDGNTVTVNIGVTPVNDAPATVADSITVAEGGTATVLVGGATSVLANDTDAENNPLNAILVAGPDNGTLTLNANGTFSYTHNGTNTTTDKFTYRANDGTANGNVVTVNIAVTPVNDAPVSADQNLTTLENNPINGAVVATDADGDTLSYSISDAPDNGTLVLNNITGAFTYTPTTNFHGSDSFTVTISDGKGGTTTSLVSVGVTSVNVAPIAIDDSATTDESTSVTIAVRANDADGDGDLLLVTGVTQGLNGSVVIDAITNNPIYTPNSGYIGTDTFTYTVDDGNGGTDTATVTVKVNAANQAPVANVDTITVAEGGTATTLNGGATSLLANDTDAENDPLISILVTGPSHGTLTLNPNGTFNYVHDGSEGNTDSFTYKVNDGTVDGNTVTVKIDVTPVNDAPVAHDDFYTINEDQSLSIPFPLSALTANDTDAEGDSLTVHSVGTPVNGSFSIVGGNLVFTPTPNFTGIASFTYGVRDPSFATSEATVYINVVAVDDPTIATADTNTIAEGSVATGNVLTNDIDPDSVLAVASFVVNGTTYSAGNTAVIVGVGSVTLAATGQYTFTPLNNDYNGSVPTITYTTNTGASSTLNIAVTPVNDDPVANDDNFTISMNTSLSIPFPLSVLAANDTDADGDSLSVVSTGSASHGTLNIVGGDLVFTPDSGFSGLASFIYGVSDGHGGLSYASVNINVTNQASVLVADSASTPEGIAAVGNVLLNDSDPDETLSITSFSVNGSTYAAGNTAVIPAIGSIILQANGSYTFTPTADYNGPVPTLTYTTNTGFSSTLDINVTPVNDAPVAIVDNIIVAEGGTATILVGGASSVLTNDFDVDGDALNAILVSGPAHGTLSLNADGTFSYTHDGSQANSDSFIYKVNDGTVDGSMASVNIGITSVNDAPVAADDNYVVAEGGTLLVSAATGVLVNDSDADGNPLDAILVTGPAHGTLTLNTDGSFSYTHDGSETNFDSFTYKVNDGSVDSNIVTVNIGVTPVNDAPVTVPDSITVLEGGTATTLVGGATSVLTNDTDVENNTLNAVLVTGPAYGTLTLNADGTFSYVHDGSESTNDSFTYKANDGTADGNIVTVSIVVTPADDASILTPDTNTVAEDSIATGNVLSNDSDADDVLNVAGFTVSGVSGTFTAGQNVAISGVGSFTLNSNGDYSFAPDANWNGSVPQVTYTTNTGSSSTLNITVTAADDPSVLVADTQTINEDNTATGNVLINDSDLDSVLQVASFNVNGTNYTAGNTATIAGVGSLQMLASGDYTFVPSANYNGTVPTITYITNTGSSTTLDITVNPVNDEPVANDDNFTTNEDVPIVIPVNALTTNDIDVDGDILTVVGVSNIQHGSLNIVGGNLIFTPDANYSGAASFQYTIFDGHGGNDTATVNITVIAVDDASVLVADTQTINEDTTATGNVLSNDSDVDSVLTLASFNVNGVDYTAGSTATIAGVGSVQMLATGDYTFVPVTNYNGTVPTITYTTNTGSTTTLNITVNPVNDDPIANDDNFSTHQNQPLTINFGDLTANDTDIDGDTLTVVGVSNIQHGSLNLVGGNLIFTPDAGYSGAASFQYDIFDGHGGKDTATVNINVLPPAGSLSLTATPTLTEAGGDIIYTATLTNAQSSTVSVTLANGEIITINAGQLTGTVTVPVTANEDVYIDPSNITNSINSVTGGDFGLVVNHSTVTTSITDTIDTTNITLTAAANMAEGGAIVYTATVGSAVTGTPLVIHLNNGVDITIPVNSTTADSVAVPVRADDAYIQGNQAVTVGIAGTSGGNFEALNTSGTVSTVVSDNGSTTNITLTAAANVIEGGSIVYTATVNSVVTDTPLVIHLSNGTDITIPVGETTADSAAVPVRADDAYAQGNQAVTVSISSTSGANYEALNTSSTVTTTVSDNGSTTNVTLTAAASTVEGGSIVYTATVGNVVTVSPLVIHLSNGTDITIPVGATSANSAAVAVRTDDAYIQGNQTVTVGISGTSGGSYEALDTSSNVSTVVSDNGSITNVTLSSAANVLEGGSIVYTATLGSVVTGTPLVIHLSNGFDITIPVGATSANSAAVPLRSDDNYIQGNQTLSVGISGTSGGNYEALDTSGTTSTTVGDDADATTVTLSAVANVNEGGSIVYTATVNNVVTDTPFVIHLSNGTDITIPVGGTTANSAAVPVRADDSYSQGDQTLTVGISSTAGGNYEAINSTSTVSTVVHDDGDVTTVTLSAPSTVAEGGSIVYTATLNSAAQGPVTVNLNNGSVITIANGALSGTVSVAAPTDDFYVDSSTVSTAITSVAGGNFETLAFNPTAASTLVTDTIGVTTLSLSGTTSIREGESGVYTLNLDHPALTALTVTLNYTGVAVNGTDFNGSTTVVIAAGDSSKTFNIAALGDTLVEGNESFTVTIASTSGGSFESLVFNNAAQSVTTTIIDNHTPAAVNDPAGGGTASIGLLSQYFSYNEGTDGPNVTNLTQINNFISTRGPDATFIATKFDYGSDALFGNNLGNGTNLQSFLGSDAASLSADPGNSTDAIIRMFGVVDLAAGNYNFKVRADDGYQIKIDGVVVAEVNANQSPTGTVHTAFSVATTGLHNIEILYWDQGGQAVFKAELSDNNGVTYNLLSAKPVYYDAVHSMSEDNSWTVSVAELLANDTDADGDTLTIVSVQNAVNGTVSLVNGNITFTPTANYNGLASYTYTVSDGHGGTDIATVTMNIASVNDAPTVSNVSVSSTSITFTAIDVDKTALGFSSPFATAFGSTTINNNGTATVLTVAEQAAAAVGILRVSDGTLSADVTGLGLGSSGNDALNGSAHTVTTALYGFGGNDTLTGGSANDLLVGGTGNDTLTGGGGVDTFNVASGTDTITDLGVGGADALVVATGATANGTIGAAYTATAATTNAGTVNLTSNGLAVDFTLAAGTVGYSITNTGAGTTLTGSNFADALTGGTGNDSLSGGGGNDTLTGGAGNDSLLGGAGNDTYNFGLNDGTDTISDSAGTDAINIASNGAVLTSLDFLDSNTSSTTGDLVITVNNQSIRVQDHFLTSNTKVESLTFTGGATYKSYALNTTYTLSNDDTGPRSTSDGINTILVGDILANTLTGKNSNDLLFGGAGADFLSGGAGADLLVGGADNDNLTGGADADTFYIDSGADTISDLGIGADVLIVDAGASVTATVTGAFTATADTSNSGTVVLNSAGLGIDLSLATGANGYTANNTSSTGATFVGSGFADVLKGGNGADTLSGGAGADTITGGKGNDSLTGGTGADTFVWNLADKGTTAAPAKDTIADFTTGASGDKLDLHDLLQNENSTNLTNYLHFTSDGTNTTVAISSSGAFNSLTNNYGTTTDQTIVLNGVNLTGGDAAIITLLKANNNLITD